MQPTILLIEEAADHRDVLSRLLRASGYRVVEADPGPEALAQAQGFAPDLILLGLSLPGQRSWETARALHGRAALARIPIRAATVYTTLLRRSRVLALGCADCVEKPYDLDDLLRRIRRLLPDTPLPALAA